MGTFLIPLPGRIVILKQKFLHVFIKEFEVRWNDLDANRHLANSSYVNFMSHTRMSFLMEHGLGHHTMIEHNIGPVVFFEHLYYFRESAMQGKVRVSFELGGASEDGMFFRFIHNFYDEKGRNLAHCEMQGGWIDLSSRKLTPLPQDLIEKLQEAPKSAEYKILTKADMRSEGRRPVDL